MAKNNKHARKSRKSRKKGMQPLPIIEPNAAGIDVGATEMYVAIPADRDPEPVRCFQTFTRDLMDLADWLERCGIRSVAMESTGVYWIPLFQILEERGIKVCLVNAKHVKNVPGRKSDVRDCQWLQYLHAVGLLKPSFRPADQVCALRTVLRHRDALVKLSSCDVNHMQKALDQMNLQLHHVISDITGVTGLAIVDAILAGERDPKVLAQLRDKRIKASEEVIVKSLEGDYRKEHLFTLRQSLEGYRWHLKQILECDQQVQEMLQKFDSQVDVTENPLPPPARRAHGVANPGLKTYDVRTEMYRVFGTDLTAIPGIQALGAQTVFAEIGCDFSKFPTAGNFVSWLGGCPDNRITGGKVLGTRTRKVKNRVMAVLRLAAQSLEYSDSFLGRFYRRMKAKIGAPAAIVAAAAKIARIIYALVTNRQAYDESRFAETEQKHKTAKENKLRAQAKALGYQLVPIEA